MAEWPFFTSRLLPARRDDVACHGGLFYTVPVRVVQSGYGSDVGPTRLDALVLSPDANRRAIHPPLPPPPPPPPQQPPTITTTITATPDGHEAQFRSCLTECQSCWLPVHQSRLSSGGARLRNSPYLPSSSWRVLPPVPRSLTAIASPPTLRRRRRRCRRRSPLPLPHHSPSL
ncbi:uncharacterized protein CIMG_13714 [Coccidioides immitis RS]|uniref:Uncharacterized protein n=1 Tax=Coccidioides immitis (strain RS) TaxID=246410 RepID=J3KBC4_COCIM|nr:uncharacterized protein CIMG_13714 [Coccidioides immitis RS]EAS32409.3 hypothetical protein CIMG_13714 [Coccidioides immitis RS]